MLKTSILVAAIGLMSSVTAHSAEMITKTSPHSVAVTVDRLSAAIEGAGAKVFARVDHAAGAASIGSDLRPTQMLMFGNPKLGTPVMALDQAAGLDLPLRVVVYETANGEVILAYRAPASLAEHAGVTGDAAILGKMTGALGKLTDKAVATE